MVGLVVFTHGSLARALLDTVSKVYGPLDASLALETGPGDSPDGLRRKLSQAMDQVDSGDGVLVLVDLVGGTPWNIAASFMGRRRMDVLAGVNLPILLKCTMERQCRDPVALAKRLLDYGQNHLERASQKLCITGR